MAKTLYHYATVRDISLFHSSELSAHARTMRGFSLKLTICLVRGECHRGGDQAEKGNDLESLHGGLFKDSREGGLFVS